MPKDGSSRKKKLNYVLSNLCINCFVVKFKLKK